MSSRTRLAQSHVARRAGTSNPVPTAHVYAWMPGEHQDWIGTRDGHKPLVIPRTKPAPLRRFKPDRGRVIRTLAQGQGTVILPGTKHEPKKRGNWATFMPTNQGALRAQGFKVPKSPSWRQEVAGWSSDYRIERGPASLFDQCGGGRGKPRRCSITRRALPPVPAYGTVPEDDYIAAIRAMLRA